MAVFWAVEPSVGEPLILQTTHRTVYRYASPATDSHNELRLRPLTDSAQRLLSFRVTTLPAAKVSSYAEPGGEVDTFTVMAPHTELSITASATVATRSTDPFGGLDLLTDDWDFYRSDASRARFAEFLAFGLYTQPHPGIAELCDVARAEHRGSVARFLLDLNALIHDRFRYMPGATDVHTKLAEVLDIGAGVCQDFAHMMIACCRTLGIPARYVSGYLFCGGDPALRGNQATHAWLECPMPDGRWLSLDPTNNLLANERYIRVHVGRDYSDVTPTRGVYVGSPGIGLDVFVDVELTESPVSR